MRGRIRHLSYANVMATLAMFIALGGTGFAASQLPANTARHHKHKHPAASWHEVGTAGQPGFKNSWSNFGGEAETVAFYKDREGVVHLKGAAYGGTAQMAIFSLPAGYRPRRGTVLEFAAVCGCSRTDTAGETVQLPTGAVDINGPGIGLDGDVILNTAGGTFVNLDGITFRAAS